MTDLEIIEKYGKDILPGFYENRLIPQGPFLEVWKSIDNHFGYQISNYGRMKSPTNKILKKAVNDWYHLVVIKGNKHIRVHVLVAKYFVENPFKKECVNHIRGFKSDNLFTQIEWCTKAENNLHSYRVLGKITPNKGKVQIQHNSRTVTAINIDTLQVKRYRHCASVSIDGFSAKVVNACCMGSKQSYKRWIFKYDEN